MLEKYEETILREVPGEDSTSREEKIILMETILKTKPKVLVETGTHRGLTTLYMLCAVAQHEFGHLYTADPFEWGQRGNFRKFPELEKYVTYHQVAGKDLPEASPEIKEGIDFMFIDGFHEKHHVVSEIEALFPYLNDGAHVYFHDTNGRNEYCDVPGGIEEKGLEVEYLKTQNGMALYVHGKKPKKTTKKTTKRKNAGSKRKV